MVGFRNAVQAAWEVTNWWDNGGDQIAFGRGDQGFVVINASDRALDRAFPTSLAAGRYCDVISGDVISGDLVDGACAGATITVDASGSASITVAARAAVAIHVKAKLQQGI
jgi:alpha-amylase